VVRSIAIAALAGEGIGTTASSAEVVSPTTAARALRRGDRLTQPAADRGCRVRRGLEPAGAPRAASRGELGGDIVLVVADRACPALDWAAEQGIDTALVPDAPTSDRRRARRCRPDLVVLAGYMRIVGPLSWPPIRERFLNTHPSLLPSFPGRTAGSATRSRTGSW